MLSLSEEEIRALNRLLPPEISPLSLEPGIKKLNGAQTLAYVRDRNSSMGDFDRTFRQRKLLSALLSRMGEGAPGSIFQAAETVIPFLETNLTADVLMYFLRNCGEYLDFPTVSVSIPCEGSFYFDTLRGMEIIRWNRERNISFLYETVYS